MLPDNSDNVVLFNKFIYLFIFFKRAHADLFVQLTSLQETLEDIYHYKRKQKK